MAGEELRPSKPELALRPALLEVESDESDRPSRLLGRLGDRPGDFEHHRDARGVIIGTGVDQVARRSQVIVMGAEDHPLSATAGSDPTIFAPTFTPSTLRARSPSRPG